MFGLGFPQLVLIFAGICFMVAGIYGLAPSFVTARFGSSAGSRPLPKEPKLSKKQARAKAREEALKLVQLQPQPQVTKEAPPAMKSEAKIVTLAPKMQAAPVVAVAPTPIVKAEPAPVARVEAVPVVAAVPTPITRVEPTPIAKTETAPIAALPVRSEPEEHDAVVVDLELVEELFSEVFALRSTMAGLVDEVKQLRSEQRSRRFIVEEVPA